LCAWQNGVATICRVASFNFIEVEFDNVDKRVCLNYSEVEINNIEVGAGRKGSTQPGIGDQSRELIMQQDSPQWLRELNQEDLSFLKRFLMHSGSLKALAGEYGISYPTVRARLDRLIAKVEAAEDPSLEDPFQRRIQMLLADGKLSREVARELLEAHRQVIEE
jgi:hypothetical protein